MFPMTLTPRREAIIARWWRILCRLACMWALAIVLLTFTAAWGMLPTWLMIALVAPGPVGTVFAVTAAFAAVSQRSPVGSTRVSTDLSSMSGDQ